MRKLLTLAIVSLLCGLTLHAQERPGLIFSEFAKVKNNSIYYELTNVGDTAIDLREFSFEWYHPNALYPEGHANHYRRSAPFDELLVGDHESKAILESGESFTLMRVEESRNTDRSSFFFGKDQNRPGYRDSADWVQYSQEFDWDINPTRLEFGWPGDSVAYNDLILQVIDQMGFCAATIWWRDTVECDVITKSLGANRRSDRIEYPIAGIDNAMANYLFVRKSNITKGNLDWHDSRGVDIEDSEWLPIYYDWNNPWNPSFFTTIGTHGDFSIDFTSETLAIDHDALTITVPWGIRKGTFNVELSHSKGIIDEIDFGPGMAYRYLEQSDSASFACMLGDTLWVYAAGADLETAGYAIIPADAEADDALVLPRRILIEDQDVKGKYSYKGASSHAGETIVTDAIGSNRYSMRCRYFVTENGEGADTITWIPFAERVDTLFKYLEKAPNATWEIDWVDGQERVDLKDGDKLIVTAGDGTSKEEYYLSLRPIIKGANASLSAITWPDVDKDEAGWDSDTIPGFKPNVKQYTIELPYGSTNIPALSFFKEDVNANVEMESAKSLRGSIEDRTTTITVTAADGRIISQYRVIFKTEVRPDDLQPFFAEPIITEVVWVLWWRVSFAEIANVGNQPLDLGKYMIRSRQSGSALDLITQPIGTDSVADWRPRYRRYVPGKKYSTYDYWADGHAGMLVDDPDVLPIIEPGECFVMAEFNGEQYLDENDPLYFPPSLYDVFWSNQIENQWGEINIDGPIPPRYIFKIVGDSILDGLKAMNDPDDFVAIDRYGDDGTTWTGEVGGIGNANATRHTFRRKPSNYLPGLAPTYNTGETAEEASWYALNDNLVDPSVGDFNQRTYYVGTSDLGNFTHDPITLYMSTVGSKVYLVDDGYEGDLKIKGVVSGTTGAAFLDNIIPKDPDQGLSVISSSTGLVLGDNDQLAAGDTLRVISKDGENTTKYTVELGALDSNAILVAIDNVYTISIDGAEGTISGIPMGVTIEEVLDNVEVPALALLNVLDADGNLIPLQALNMSDSTYRKVMLMGEVYFEVIAQDGTTIITYLLDQGILSSDAWVTSNVYTVNQENMTITDILEGTTVDILLSNLVPAGNALMKLYDKAGYQRDSGYIAIDDMVGVTSEDGSKTVTYSLRQLGYVANTAAWVKSDVYNVNEGTSSIDEIPANTDVSEFLSNIEIPGGAYLKLMDAGGAEKEEGVILGTDKLEVTSEDLSNVVTYTLNLLVSVHHWSMDEMKVYPNPVSDVVYIEGLEGRCLIELTSMNGQKLRSVRTSDPVCELSVSSLSAGMYILRVTDNHLNVKVMQVVKCE